MNLLGHAEPIVARVASLVDPVASQLGIEAFDERLLFRIGLFYAALVMAGLAVHVVLFLYFQARSLRWEERVAALQNNPWDVGEAARVLLFLMALYFGVSLAREHLSGAREDEPGWVILQSAFFHLAGIAFVLRAARRQRLSWQQAFGMGKKRFAFDVARGAVLYLAMMPLVIVYSVLYQRLLQSLGIRASPQDVIVMYVSDPSLWGRVYTFCLAALIAPVFEEMLFRGVAFPVLARYRGTMWAMVVLAAAFALIHFHLPSLAPLFIVALALSVGYVYTGSLTVPIVAHSLFNVVNLIVLTLLRGGL